MTKSNTEPEHFGRALRHGGFMYSFVDIASGELNSPVYFYREKKPEAVRVAESYSQWMYDHLCNEVQILSETARMAKID